MYTIGVDVGSTFTKYCIMNDEQIADLFLEKTPIRQTEYFDKRVTKLREDYPEAKIVSCGYGKQNVIGCECINELTALAKGCFFVTGCSGTVLDIGGQDTKIILQDNGKLQEFYINEKCAAGSGMFLSNVLDMINIEFKDIDLEYATEKKLSLSSTCAVFAQSEIVKLIVNNWTEQEIIQAVLWQIFSKAKVLLSKVKPSPLLLSGGLNQIHGIDNFATTVLGRKCTAIKEGTYLAAIGCTIYGL